MRIREYVRQWLELDSSSTASQSDGDARGKPQQVDIGAPTTEQMYYEASRRHLDYQISAFDSIDAQSTQMFSIASLALPLTFAVLNLGKDGGDIPRTSIVFLAISLVSYVSLLGFMTMQMLGTKMRVRPDISYMREKQLHLPGIVNQRWVSNEMQQSIADNEQTLKRKTFLAAGVKVSARTEGICLATAALWAVLSTGGFIDQAKTYL